MHSPSGTPPLKIRGEFLHPRAILVIFTGQNSPKELHALEHGHPEAPKRNAITQRLAGHIEFPAVSNSRQTLSVSRGKDIGERPQEAKG